MLSNLTYLWPLVVILVTWAALEFVFRRYGDTIAKWAPGWKSAGLTIIMRVLGIIAAMDPSLFAPLIGHKPWAGMALFFIGQLLVGIRSVTAVPGDNISKPLQTAVALHTIVRAPAHDVVKGAEYLANREDNATDRKLTEKIGSAAATKLKAAGRD